MTKKPKRTPPEALNSEDFITKVLEVLPHGSGFDDNPEIEDNTKRENFVTFRQGFHVLDQNGYYSGWLSVQIIIFRYEAEVLHPLRVPEGSFQVVHKAGDIDAKVFVSNDNADLDDAEISDYQDYIASVILEDLEEAGITSPLGGEIFTPGRGL